LISAHDPSIDPLFDINLVSVQSLTEYAGYKYGKFVERYFGGMSVAAT
jgi:hypothetical protein